MAKSTMTIAASIAEPLKTFQPGLTGAQRKQAVAAMMEKDFQVKVIEAFPARARELSATLDSTIVLLGDAANPDLLLEENIESMDVFCALTNDDEANILSSMLAKRTDRGDEMFAVMAQRPARQMMDLDTLSLT